MAMILPFGRKAKTNTAQPAGPVAGPAGDLGALLDGFSIEVMPRTAEKIEDFRAILPAGTRVYVAHIDGTPFEDMLATAGRLVNEGFAAMPHFPARGIADAAELERRIAAYREVGVSEALLLAGGIDTPAGTLTSSMDMMTTGLFDRYGYTRLHVAGHPEGNKDIDADGSDREVMKALKWKNAFQAETDAKMAIATQFLFEAQAAIDWADRLRANGITMPVHLGVAGPAKLQTLIKFAMACGVGSSLRVLQRRAADLSKLMLPFTPEALLRDLAAHKAAHPDSLIEAVHFFPLGGIGKTAEFTDAHGARAAAAATA